MRGVFKRSRFPSGSFPPRATSTLVPGPVAQHACPHRAGRSDAFTPRAAPTGRFSSAVTRCHAGHHCVTSGTSRVSRARQKVLVPLFYVLGTLLAPSGGVMWRHVRTTATDAWQALSTALISRPPPPREVVRSALNRVNAILNATASMSGSVDKLPQYARAGLRRISHEVIDLEQMARGAISRHSAGRPAAERLAFVQRFTDLLERLYVDLARQSRWVSVLHSSEAIDGQYARVKWKIGTLRVTAALEYRLRLSNGRWKIFDVLLNGHSFITSCRQEFDQKIGSSSYAAVVREMQHWDSLGFIGPDLTLAPPADLTRRHD